MGKCFHAAEKNMFQAPSTHTVRDVNYSLSGAKESNGD